MKVDIYAVLEKGQKKIGTGLLKKSKLRDALLDIKNFKAAKEFIAFLPNGDQKRFIIESSQQFDSNDKVVISLAKIKQLQSVNAK